MKVLIAAGGTGGHLFPGIALAEAFIERNNRTQVLFIGTKRGLEERVLAQERFPLQMIDAAGVRGKNLMNLCTALISLIKGGVQSLTIIRQFHPDLVIGLGSYVSGPVLVAASLMGIATVLHEQNVLPGFTNRVLSRMAQLIFVSFEQTLSYFPHTKTILVGNPIRKRSSNLIPLSPSPLPFTLLVVGGSLGSQQLNRAMSDALAELLTLRHALHIIHQAGEHDLTLVSNAYQRMGFSAEVLPFIDQMGSVYHQAHLVVCRAGATTIAELMLHHKPSILIPYPFASDQHQHLNAKAAVSKGAALMIDPAQLTGKRLAELILHLYHHSEERYAMETNAAALARPHAAQEIVEHCYNLVARRQCINE